MSTTVAWINPIEGTEFEPEVVHLGSCPMAIEPEADTWAQILGLSDASITVHPSAITLLVIRYDKRFRLLGTLYRERDRQALLEAFARMQSQSTRAWVARWSDFYESVEIASTQARFETLTELVRYLKAVGQQTSAAASVA